MFIWIVFKYIVRLGVLAFLVVGLVLFAECWYHTRNSTLRFVLARIMTITLFLLSVALEFFLDKHYRQVSLLYL